MTEHYTDHPRLGIRLAKMSHNPEAGRIVYYRGRPPTFKRRPRHLLIAALLFMSTGLGVLIGGLL